MKCRAKLLTYMLKSRGRASGSLVWGTGRQRRCRKRDPRSCRKKKVQWECFHRRARRRGHHHRHWWSIMYQMTNDVDDQENHGYLKYKSLKVTAMGNNIPNLENNRWLRSKGTDREEEVYMFQEALDKLAHLGTSCPMKRGGDLCRIKEDGKFSCIPMALVHRIHRR